LLERRTRTGGKDVVDAGKQADDAANACCGLIRELQRKRGWLALDGWQEEKVTKNAWQHPADVRQRELLDRVRQPVAMMPVDVLLQQLRLTDRQQRMLDRAVETVAMPMRTAFLRDFCDRLAPSPADGAVDASIDLACNALRRAEAIP
jgi:hypothetical protein